MRAKLFGELSEGDRDWRTCPRGESTRSAVSLSWSVWLEGWRKIRCGRQMLLAQSHGASKVRP